MTALNVVDADGHVLEPVSAWKNVPEQYRIRIERDKSGLDFVYVGSELLVTVALGKIATPGSRMSDFSHMPTIDEALRGGFDPVQRLKDMTLEGIDAAVMYPTIGLYFWALKDPKAAVTLARAYNDWLAEYCSADAKRMYGAAAIPIQDPKAAAQELKRAVEELGFVAGFVRPNPCNGKVLSDPSHDVIWQMAQDLNVPIGIHEGSSIIIDTVAHTRPHNNPMLLHAVSHPFEEMLTFGNLCCDGVFERFPKLQWIFLESGASWAPFWMWRMDEQVKGFGGFCPQMKLKPSEYFKRQCWSSCEIDEDPVPDLIHHIGEDRLVWGSDYPHHDSTFPGATKKLRKLIAPLDEKIQKKVLGSNACRVYNLE